MFSSRNENFQATLIVGICLILALGVGFIVKTCQQQQQKYSGKYNFNIDHEGNEFKSVLISDQEWMESNLRVTTFQNGDKIFIAKNSTEWKEANNKNIPACCWFKFNKNNSPIYGLYYNHYAVTDPRGLAPKGWKIPSVSDFNKHIAAKDVCYRDHASIDGWSMGGSGFNKSGLNVLASVMTDKAGSFYWGGTDAKFWTSDLVNKPYSNYAYILSMNQERGHYDDCNEIRKELVTCGIPVRCLKIKD